MTRLAAKRLLFLFHCLFQIFFLTNQANTLVDLIHPLDGHTLDELQVSTVNLFSIVRAQDVVKLDLELLALFCLLKIDHELVLRSL